MKTYISLILTGLLMSITISAQNSETLTNSSVIKMSRANLADELIIDMINNSPVKFDLSPGALKLLQDEGASAAVIQSMQDAAVRKDEPVTAAPVTVKSIIPEADASGQGSPEQAAWKSSDVMEKVSVEALNYAGPLTGMIRFNESRFENTELVLAEWDRQVRAYIADINKVKAQISEVEIELREKKNADTRAFGAEIVSLKGKQEAYRKNYRQLKDAMIKGGFNIVKQIEGMSIDATKEIGKAYSVAGQQVSSYDTDPSSGEKTVTQDYSVRAVNNNCVSYLVYMNEILAWYQNEITEIDKLIKAWNPRVTAVIREDAQLISQAEPIENRIRELSSNTKLNKAEISGLKKQLSGIEKSRKQLSDKMKDDAKELVSGVKQMSQASQEAVKERFMDIIENVTYCFTEKLSL